jgi:chorismate mutase-like protein
MHLFHRAATLALSLFLFSSCATRHQGSDTAELGSLMVKRLGWMDEVARVKQAKRQPVLDSAREAVVLRSMERQGAAAGIPARAVRDFFSGQMEAARLRQVEWLKAHPHPLQMAAPPDLSKTVRPALDKIGMEMIHALSRSRAARDASTIVADARQQLTVAGYSPAVIAAALRGLEHGLKP